MKRITIICLCLFLFVLAGCQGNGRVGVMTNEATDRAEARVGIATSDNWEVGVLGQLYSTELQGKDFGGGFYGKMTVDPNGSIAVADWIGWGEMIGLPESIVVETYGVGKIIYTDNHTDDPFSAGAGAGFSVGPFCAELIYEIVEGGDVANPDAKSGLELWFGAALPF